MYEGRVLVLDADIVPALCVVRSLGTRGLYVVAAASEPNPIAAYSKHVKGVCYYPSPLEDAVGFRTWIKEKIASGEFDLIIPVTERPIVAIAPLLDDEKCAAVIALPPRDVLESALNKDETMRIAAAAGLSVPASVLVKSSDDCGAVVAGMSFPLVVKPSRSVGENSKVSRQLTVTYAYRESDLRAAVAQATRFGPVLVQEYVAGIGVGVEVIADHGEVICAFQHRRLHELPLSGGGSSLREGVTPTPTLLDAAKRLIRAMRWHGVAMVEFKHDPATGAYSLMEVNGRFWGSIPLAVASGADFPGMLYDLMVNGMVTQVQNVRAGVICRHLAKDISWTEHVMRRIGDPAVVRFPTTREVFRDWLTVFSPMHRFDVQSLHDLRPGFVDLVRIVTSYIERAGEIWRRRAILRLQKRKWAYWKKRLRTGADIRSVLFVCYGNINRSPVAQRISECTLASRSFTFSSCGFHETGGRAADSAMVRIAGLHGIDLHDWRSNVITVEMVERSDLILVMELTHLQKIESEYETAADKTLLLGLAPGNGATAGVAEIEDPYGKTEAAYEACVASLDAAIQRLAEMLPAKHRAMRTNKDEMKSREQ